MIPEKVRAELERLGLEALQFEPGSTPTAPLAAARIGVQVGQIAKSLLFRAKDGRYHMIVCAGDRRVNSSKLKALAGGKCSMADGEEALRVTGYPPGGVCPYGIDPDVVTVWIDESLAVWDRVYPAAGTDSTGVPTSFDTLRELASGRTCAVTE